LFEACPLGAALGPEIPWKPQPRAKPDGRGEGNEPFVCATTWFLIRLNAFTTRFTSNAKQAILILRGSKEFRGYGLGNIISTNPVCGLVWN
jgi:hypothetical protein